MKRLFELIIYNLKMYWHMIFGNQISKDLRPTYVYEFDERRLKSGEYCHEHHESCSPELPPLEKARSNEQRHRQTLSDVNVNTLPRYWETSEVIVGETNGSKVGNKSPMPTIPSSHLEVSVVGSSFCEGHTGNLEIQAIKKDEENPHAFGWGIIIEDNDVVVSNEFVGRSEKDHSVSFFDTDPGRNKFDLGGQIILPPGFTRENDADDIEFKDTSISLIGGSPTEEIFNWTRQFKDPTIHSIPTYSADDEKDKTMSAILDQIQNIEKVLSQVNHRVHLLEQDNKFHPYTIDKSILISKEEIFGQIKGDIENLIDNKVRRLHDEFSSFNVDLERLQTELEALKVNGTINSMASVISPRFAALYNVGTNVYDPVLKIIEKLKKRKKTF